MGNYMKFYIPCLIFFLVISDIYSTPSGQVESELSSEFTEVKNINVKMFYNEWKYFSVVADNYFSPDNTEENITISKNCYLASVGRFLSATDSYRSSLGNTFAIHQEIYTNDILEEVSLMLTESLQGNKTTADLLYYYINSQRLLVEYYYFLNASNQMSGSIIAIMLCVFSVLTLFSLIFFINYTKRRRMYIQLEKQVEEQRLVVKVQEDERERMGAELHDTVAQDIKVLQMFVAQLEPNLEKTNENRHLLEQIHQLENRSLSSLYGILNKLVPPELESGDFKGALLSLCGDFIRSSGMECIFYMEPGTRINDLDGETRMQVFRILQEALTNIEKHSQASTCTISMREQNDRILMFISDDGIGLGKGGKSGTFPNYGGFGLRGMEARTSLIGGDFRIRWDEDGTEIRLEIPI